VICGLGGSSLAAYVIGFGVVTGCGVGFGYAATTPASIKWFPPQKTGLIAGIVVAGFGLAPVVLAPLSAWFLDLFASTDAEGVVEQGVPGTMIALGVVTWAVVGGLSFFIRNPPEGLSVQPRQAAGAAAARMHRPEYAWRDMLRTAQFWLLFAMYFCGAAAGLTFISVASDLGKHALGSLAFLAVVVLAVGNSSGRVVAGSLSDRMGRQWTLLAEFVCQAVVVGVLYLVRGSDAPWPVILVVVFLLGFNYGTNLAVFPAVCKDYYGIRSFGLNYGCLFAAFGSAGLVMPWLNGLIEDRTGSSDLSYLVIVVALAVAAVLAGASRLLGRPGGNEAPAVVMEERA
jgi:MFS family permease